MRLKSKKFNLLIIIGLIVYASYTFVIQEVEYKKYQELKIAYLEQIKIAKSKTDEYKKYSEYVKSDEYIEKVAREQLGLVYPEEKIYIEINN